MSEVIGRVRTSLLRALGRKFPGEPFPELCQAIEALEDLDLLLRCFEEAVVTPSLEKFATALEVEVQPRRVARFAAATLNAGAPPSPWVSPLFLQNRTRFPLEQLRPYFGQHIAWSYDGTAVVASADDELELFRQVVAAGHDPERVVFDYVEELPGGTHK
jgi:hypothetical protein